MIRLIMLFFVLFLAGCQNDPKEYSPKASLIEWQKLVDQGLFTQAEKLSSTSTLDWFQNIDKTYVEDSINSITMFYDINCVIEQDTAICAYYLLENGDKIYSSTQLVRIADTWLVDIHDE